MKDTTTVASTPATTCRFTHRNSSAHDR